MTLTVGQKLVYAPRDRRRSEPYEVTVERVGRKWAYLCSNQGRVDIETLAMDGGQYASPGECFGTWEEYHETTELHKTWAAFRTAISNLYGHPPGGVTVADIEQAKRILKLGVA